MKTLHECLLGAIFGAAIGMSTCYLADARSSSQAAAPTEAVRPGLDRFEDAYRAHYRGFRLPTDEHVRAETEAVWRLRLLMAQVRKAEGER